MRDDRVIPRCRCCDKWPGTWDISFQVNGQGYHMRDSYAHCIAYLARTLALVVPQFPIGTSGTKLDIGRFGQVPS